jgi:hypothetical protein
MSSDEQYDARERGSDRAEHPAPHPGYASWWKSSIGQDFVRAKASMNAVREGKQPPYGWPKDSEGIYLPAEGPLRVFSGTEHEPAPEGWVKVVGYSDLRQLMLAQIVVEYSICDAHELVDFIASNY